MKRAFSHLPIRLKLIAMIMTTCVASVVLASVGYLLIDYYQTRAELERDLHAQAELILQNSVAALEFDDQEAARETLNTLASKPNIRVACLYQRGGHFFAGYHQQGETAVCLPQAMSEGTRFGSESVQLAREGKDDGKRFGSVLLRSDLAALARRGRAQLLIVGLLLIVALGLAVLMSSKLQAVVSDPLIALSKTAGEVTRRGDYSLRAIRTTDDELGDSGRRLQPHARANRGARDRALPGERGSAPRDSGAPPRRTGARRAAGARARGEPAERRVPGHTLARAPHAAQRHPRMDKLLRANAVPSPSVDRALEKVERNAQVQSRLIEDLLEVSRIVSGKLRLDSALRPGDALQHCRGFDAPGRRKPGVTIERHFERASMPTSGDPDRLQQVIWNLLSNAVKFTPAGGTCRRRAPGGRVTTSSWSRYRYRDRRRRFCRTCSRASARPTRQPPAPHGGLGLGLSIVSSWSPARRRVSAAERREGRGATFTVRLPVRSAEPPPGRRARARAARRPSRDVWTAGTFSSWTTTSIRGAAGVGAGRGRRPCGRRHPRETRWP